MKKKLCILTSCRADYDLLRNLIRIFLKSKKIKLSLVITGQHLSKYYGNASNVILKDFKKISKTININIGKSDQKNIANSVSIGVRKISRYFRLNKPSLLILLGDRYEILSAGISAFLNQIPIAHVHGGEITKGSYDDTVRHSITKLSHYHFVSHKRYKKRVIQLGENPNTVFNVGSLGAENVSNIIFFSKELLEKKLKVKFERKIFLITINSFIEDKISIKELLINLFRVLNKFKKVSFIFTMSNSDLKSDLINKNIKYFCKTNRNSHYFKYLGADNYLSLMKISNVVIGNSSSGILETPSLRIPTINIGTRQEGRIFSKNIINCTGSYQSIYKSVKKTLSKNFTRKMKDVKNPLFKRNTSSQIRRIIETKILSQKTQKKIFYDAI